MSLGPAGQSCTHPAQTACPRVFTETSPCPVQDSGSTALQTYKHGRIVALEKAVHQRRHTLVKQLRGGLAAVAAKDVVKSEGVRASADLQAQNSAVAALI